MKPFFVSSWPAARSADARAGITPLFEKIAIAFRSVPSAITQSPKIRRFATRKAAASTYRHEVERPVDPRIPVGGDRDDHDLDEQRPEDGGHPAQVDVGQAGQPAAGERDRDQAEGGPSDEEHTGSIDTT